MLGGHDAGELHAAIKDTLGSIVKLRVARDKAVERFKREGPLLTIVPAAKGEKEEEALM